MVFVRTKRVKGRLYFQVVKTVTENGKSKQVVVKHLGNEEQAKKYCEKEGIPFNLKEPTAAPSFFDSAKQRSEFVTAIEGRNELLMKFHYMGDGANSWETLVSDPEYGLGSTESNLIHSHRQEILKEVGEKINLIDLGCGTGEKATIFLEKMRKKDAKYAALDISRDMLDKAKHRIENRFKELNCEFQRIDFEEGNFANITENLRDKNNSKNLILFLGNTLGNVSDKNRVLSNIREGMTLNDHLIVGIELFDIKRIQEILNHYQSSPIVRELLFTTLRNFGVQPNTGSFEVTFNKNKNQVEFRFRIKKPILFSVGYKKIHLKPGMQLLMGFSYKPSTKGIQILLAETGYIMKRIFLTQNEDYALILCKPARL